MIATTENQDFIDFLETYESENFAEILHQALYYVAGEGEPQKEKQQICGVLYQIRMQLNDLQVKYLPPKDSLPTTVNQKE